MQHKGFATLLSVLVVGAVGTAIAVSLLLLGLSSSRTSFVYEQEEKAKALAAACVEKALGEIRDFTPFIGTGNLTLGQGSCSYTVTDQGVENRLVTASGIVGTIVHKVKVTINNINPNLNITLWQEIADF